MPGGATQQVGAVQVILMASKVERIFEGVLGGRVHQMQVMKTE